jgi:hypothetical protein
MTNDERAEIRQGFQLVAAEIELTRETLKTMDETLDYIVDAIRCLTQAVYDTEH